MHRSSPRNKIPSSLNVEFQWTPQVVTVFTYTAWEKGRALVWDATFPDSLPNETWLVERNNQVWPPKKLCYEKYSKIKLNHHFVAFAVESSPVVEGSSKSNKQNRIESNCNRRRAKSEKLLVLTNLSNENFIIFQLIRFSALLHLIVFATEYLVSKLWTLQDGLNEKDQSVFPLTHVLHHCMLFNEHDIRLRWNGYHSQRVWSRLYVKNWCD